MQTILDQTQDLAGREIHRLTTLYPTPEFVKDASYSDLCGDRETLQRHVYGDQFQQLYPCHTAAATYLSAMFFFDKRAAFEPRYAETVENRIQQLARFFKIGGLLDELQTKMAADATNDAAKLPDETFAHVVTIGTNKYRHCPLRNPGEVKAAAAWFNQYAINFPYAQRAQVAERILEKSASLGVALDQAELLEKTAGFGIVSATEAAALVQSRALAVRSRFPAEAEEMLKMANLIRENTASFRNRHNLMQLAGVIDLFDRRTGLINHYGDEYGPPEDTLFMITEKVAHDLAANHFSTSSGSVYSAEQLAGLKLSQVQDYMGSEFAAAVSTGNLLLDQEKLASIVPTLPRDDAAMFERLLESIGVQPFAKEAAVHELYFTPERLYALALRHKTQSPSRP